MTYQHILFAADFSDDALRVGERAKEIARRCGARLSMIHVVEDISINLGGGYELLPVLPELPDEALLGEARKPLGELARRLDGGCRNLGGQRAVHQGRHSRRRPGPRRGPDRGR